MIHPIHWLERRSVVSQLSLLAIVLGPLTAVGGYVLAPRLSIAPHQGLLVGLVVGTTLVIAWLTHYANTLK